jgi:fructan beta-fructosidase
MKKLIQVLTYLFFSSLLIGQNIVREYKITRQYLNFPVEMKQDRQHVNFVLKKDTITYSVIRITDDKPDYWVFKDVSAYKGKKLKLVFNSKVKGIDMIYQSDQYVGSDSLYREINRPQFHFTSARGWNNDPNGLVYFDGEYHLFYQHNPYEIHWENMHWGHAVSKDLLHWTELNDALYPDTLGTMFSGSAVIDKDNTSGWGKNAMVVAYTAAGRKPTQCIAFSLDNGRTFSKYENNPVIPTGSRDPKVFWYNPAKCWVMALYVDNSIAIYNSKDLKKWEYKSKTKGFYECPELFELSVDGDENNKKWVMYGASGTYMTGIFDGAVFSPEYGKYFNSWGSQYAAQTYNNIPDGRRIQIGWGRIEQPGMPFNQMMLFPAELSLRTTPEGVRLFSEPVREVSLLHNRNYYWENLSGAELNEKLKEIDENLLHVKMDIEIDSGTGFDIHFKGKRILNYDGNFNRFNGAPYICDNPGSFRFEIELLIDRTSVEAYIGNGKLFISEGLKPENADEGLKISEKVKIHSFELNEMESIWK